MRHHHRFDGVGDELAAGQRIAHAAVSLGPAVADGDGRELEGRAAGGDDAFAGRPRDLVEVLVAGHQLVL